MVIVQVSWEADLQYDTKDGLEKAFCQWHCRNHLHVHCSDLSGDKTSIWCVRWSWKGCSAVTLERLYMFTAQVFWETELPIWLHWGSLCTFIVQVSQGASSQWDRFTQKMFIKRPFAGDTGEAHAHSLFICPRKQNSLKGCADLARTDFGQFPL